MEQKTLIFKLLFVFVFSLVLSPVVQSQKLITGKAKVIDGDTADVDIDLGFGVWLKNCLLYTSPSPRDATLSRMQSSA